METKYVYDKCWVLFWAIKWWKSAEWNMFSQICTMERSIYGLVRQWPVRVLEMTLSLGLLLFSVNLSTQTDWTCEKCYRMSTICEELPSHEMLFMYPCFNLTYSSRSSNTRCRFRTLTAFALSSKLQWTGTQIYSHVCT